MFTHMLIGIDGQPGGREAIALARTLSVLCPEADLTFGYVLREPPLPSRGHGSEVGPAVLQAELEGRWRLDDSEYRRRRVQQARG